jgi:dUTP pyrophosphatase
MTDDLQNYIKELIHLKKLGLISNDELNELDELLVMSKELESAGFSEYKDVNKTEIKFVNTSENPDPIWAKDGDSGFDLRANISGTIKPLERLLIPTGLYFELPDGYDMEIKSRSGLASKHGIGVLTGTIDLNYKGEVMVLLFNISNDVFNFQKGDRLAQAVVRSRVSTEFGKLVKLESREYLSQSERGSGGFGSTGKN